MPHDLRSLLTSICAAAPSAVAWKNVDAALAGEGDLDLIADEHDLHAIEDATRAWLSDRGITEVLTCRHVPGAMFIAALTDEAYVQVDVKTRATWKSAPVFTMADALSLSQTDEHGLRRLRPGAEAVFVLLINGMAAGGRRRPGRLDPARIRALIEADPGGLATTAERFGGRHVERLARAFASGGWDARSAAAIQARLVARAARTPGPAIQKAWFRFKIERTCRGLKRELGDTPDEAAFRRWIPRHAGREAPGGTSGDTGRVVLIAGPDGAGKTSIVLGLIDGVLAEHPTRRVHHRDGISVLPARKNRGPSSQPHRHAPYPWPIAIAKVFYIWADIVVGWQFRVRPFLRRGGWIVMERGWWDMAVDQRRYRLQKVGWLVRALGRFVPTPDVILLVTAPAETVFARSPELPLEEIRRQIDAWPAAVPAGARVQRIDATRPVEEVVAAAEAVVGGLPAWPRAIWAGLPSRGAPRWWVPTSPRVAASAGLLIHQPMSGRALFAWRVARIAARAGILRRLPRAAPPPILPPLRTHFADAAAVAIARSTHPHRFTALALDHDGRPTGFAKVALDEEGRTALAGEAAALEEHGGALTGPVRAPGLLGKSDGVLALEPVDWIPRRRPWFLPAEVAAALGAMYAAGAVDGLGPAHGDCAPWNLLRTADGWVLIDWEHARRAPAFHDVVHHLAQAYAHLGRPSASAVVAALRGRGEAARAIAVYARAAELEPAGAGPAMVVLLREQLATPAGPDPRAPAARAAKRRLLQRLEAEGFDG